MEKGIAVAKIGRAVGLKGEMKFYLYTDFPEQFKNGARFFIKNKEVTIQYYYPEREIIKFIEINSIDEAKLLTNSVIYATEEETRKNCRLREGEFFWFEIIGCKIIENGVFLGTVKDIYRYPSSDYLLIETNEKLLKKTKVSTFLIPYVDRYIKNVNIEEKEIFTQNGLLLLESL